LTVYMDAYTRIVLIYDHEALAEGLYAFKPCICSCIHCQASV